MANRISKVDRDTIEQLVEKYSAQAVINVAKSVKKAKAAKAGRPKNFRLNLAFVWAHIEYLRKNSENSRTTNACRAIAKRLAKFTSPPHPSASTLRRMHWEAEKLRDSDVGMKAMMDDQLAFIATQVVQAGKRGRGLVTFPVLWRKTKLALETGERSTVRTRGILTLDLTRP